MRRLALAFCLLPLGAAAVTPQRPVVLELFTSQSCSSCPRADALLAELGRTEPDVLPLDFHVDYWNNLGWRDIFSFPAATARQRAYAMTLGTDLYTPELVVAGHLAALGSDSAAVRAAIAQARLEQAAERSIVLTAHLDSGRVAIDIGPGVGAGYLAIAGFDRVHTTQIGGGENGGRTLSEINVVRGWRDLGAWNGTQRHLTADLPDGDQAAILLQDSSGRVLAATLLVP